MAWMSPPADRLDHAPVDREVQSSADPDVVERRGLRVQAHVRGVGSRAQVELPGMAARQPGDPIGGWNEHEVGVAVQRVGDHRVLIRSELPHDPVREAVRPSRRGPYPELGVAGEARPPSRARIGRSRTVRWRGRCRRPRARPDSPREPRTRTASSGRTGSPDQVRSDGRSPCRLRRRR